MEIMKIILLEMQTIAAMEIVKQMVAIMERVREVMVPIAAQVQDFMVQVPMVMPV